MYIYIYVYIVKSCMIVMCIAQGSTICLPSAGEAQGEPEAGEDIAFAIGYERWTQGGKQKCAARQLQGGIHGDAANLI